MGNFLKEWSYMVINCRILVSPTNPPIQMSQIMILRVKVKKIMGWAFADLSTKLKWGVIQNWTEQKMMCIKNGGPPPYRVAGWSQRLEIWAV